ncbi:MAG: diaminopimelate epimerase [Verrucomicrobia bacterium]|nr:MAG: diaminopimelate epimerase [Verrucomicrobiota bacterium]
MKIPFWKMHGAANDFILVDDRAQTFPAADQAWLAQIMARHTGIGSEGLLLVQPSQQADFRMRFFNPDGGEAEMCGNGARCIARFAHDRGVAPANMQIETVAGEVRADILGARVRLHMPPPRDWQLNQRLTAEGRAWTYHFVNTGVPHVVLEADDLAVVDVARVGAAIRRHAAFAPRGTNVNFIHVEPDHAVRVRTFERGVEAETLACGTGMVACALIAGKLGRTTPPVRVQPASGDELEVHFVLTPDGARDVTLLGPAQYVFQGELNYPAAT